MFGDAMISFREFVMQEPLPIGTIQVAVLEFMKGRTDAVLYGAMAVNAYVNEPRMTQDIDIASTRAKQLADEIRAFLHERFHIAVRVRTAKEGVDFRVYQVRKPENRHLVDVRQVDALPPSQTVGEILVLTPPELACAKIMAIAGRSKGKLAKVFTDKADLIRLLQTFPELQIEEGSVADCLRAAGATQAAWKVWREVAAEEIEPDDEEDGY
jgi:hypothetical protein